MLLPITTPNRPPTRQLGIAAQDWTVVLGHRPTAAAG